MQLSFAPLVKKTAPAVVNVYATRMVRQQTPFERDPFFQRFFGNRMQQRSRKQSSLGSGVIVDKKGLIVTNDHVIQDADQIKVALDDGREFQANVVLKDQKVDLAVLKIEKGPNDLPTLPIGNSDDVEVGDLVLAIGNPFGVGQTVTSGIVSGLARTSLDRSHFGFFIQTDAAINPGNSGGPLVGIDGRMIGINSEIYSRSGGSDGIGFAIPANLVKSFVSAAESGDKQFAMPYIGASFESLTPDVADALGLDRPRGALVNKVAPDGPAAKAGLKAGDVVTALDGKPVQHPDALGYRLATEGIGKTVELTVRDRDGKHTMSIALERAPETVPANRTTIGGRTPFTGATVANLSPRVAQELDMQSDAEGVVITDVADGSLAARFGLEPKDILVRVNGQAIGKVADVKALADDPPGSWQFAVRRDGRLLTQSVR
ncbi:DegQ family serine endoprotease [Pararhizobium mangrovi]|uniref:DegQ family serine endoprotease n=2 Tax=Pararhizobium mangrovi TaxID=2590452 RepID=A0A506U9V8_9HYPH|nr:DegQ family serine endoprotease [Pararhizobium mangrovi]